MRRTLLVAAAALTLAGLGAGAATAATSSATIDRKGELLAGLAVEVQLTVTCSAPEVTTPIMLSLQLQQLQQEKGASPTVVSGSASTQTVVCDGTEQAYTAVVRTFAPVGQPLPLFEKGTALATASLFSCGTQFCSIVGTQAVAEVRIH
jgi:hypothetical protein